VPLAETPIDSGDTAPLLNGTLLRADAPPQSRVELTPAAPAAAPDSEAAPAQTDLLGDGLGEAGETERVPRLGPDGKPRDVPTRTILRAVTQLLLEKQIVGREELLERVRALAAREE
jgi:hypothetical protein